MPLGDLTPRRFLAEHWQKKPLLVRGAFPGFRSPLSPEELAGLACEEGVESRLILERGGEHPWQLRTGPFRKKDFTGLPRRGYTLLVHEIDRHVPAVARILDSFRFIPNWRIDDVMVSYAPPGGSVGAHTDDYDVFLLQGLGRRRWRIRRRPLAQEHLVPDLEVKILESFTPDAEWVLEPGDMLYLPPRVAHHGIALDASLTFSIGFRAPARAQLLAGWAGEVLESAKAEELYEDSDLRAQREPGEITPAALRRMRRSLRDLLADDEHLDRWFGRFITEPTREQRELPLEQPLDARKVRQSIERGSGLRRSAVARFAFTKERGGAATLFVGGREYFLEKRRAFAAPLLTGRTPLDHAALARHLGSRRFLELVTELINRGYLLFDE